MFTDWGVQGVFPPTLGSLVMTNCPQWAWSTDHGHVTSKIFLQIYVSVNIPKTVQDRDIRTIED